MASSRGARLIGFFGGFLLAAMLAVVGWLWSSLHGGPSIDVSRVTVVRQIQQLARLETVLFGMDKIVAGGEENKYLPQFLVGDRLLLLAYGEVTAGVDLARLDEAQVDVTPGAVRITLPEAEIFTVRVDNERTRVFSRQTGLFTRVDPQLESEVRREAERQMRQAAIDNGILHAAADNARHTLRAFVKGLGVGEVEIRN